MRITVSQLNNYIKQVFDAEELLHNVEVIGDIEGLKTAGNTVYFSLKDESATINCVCYYPFKMKSAQNGTNVVVRGTVSYWHKAGKISFVVNSCEVFGWGSLFLKFQQLQEKLKAEGLFDAGIKKPLPACVKRLGIVTSTSGAVIHDIKVVTHRRDPSVDLVVFGTCVQGDGADTEIARAIEFFNNCNSSRSLFCEENANDRRESQHTEQSEYILAKQTSGIKPVDVIIVARGGGSKDDLNAFNSERVARAVFTSKIPIVSAVGHESDWTLIDFVADLRAATPSAAAELCIPEVLTKRELALRSWSLLRSVMMRKVDAKNSATQNAWLKLRSGTLDKLTQHQNRLEQLMTYCEANNPLAILKHGYTKINKTFDELKTGDEFEAVMYNGIIGAEVKWTKTLK